MHQGGVRSKRRCTVFLAGTHSNPLKGVNAPMGKQICVIPFRRQFLIDYTLLAPTPLEIAESVDMMRVLENGLKVRMVATRYNSQSVDTESDRLRVEQLLRADVAPSADLSCRCVPRIPNQVARYTMFIQRKVYLSKIARIRVSEGRDLAQGLRLDRNEKVDVWPRQMMADIFLNKPDYFSQRLPGVDAIVSKDGEVPWGRRVRGVAHLGH